MPTTKTPQNRCPPSLKIQATTNQDSSLKLQPSYQVGDGKYMFCTLFVVAYCIDINTYEFCSMTPNEMLQMGKVMH
jgi:hypothetical protein